MAGLCGACTLFFLGMSVFPNSGAAAVAPIALVVGGLPTALGVGLVLLGRWIYRGFRD